ncbi:hypothetical protein PLESTB_000818700 [Pleodorina starrii]|uniref:Histone deacetylase complex subunit SAP30 Sin3 binding domain-containing protein n=1 Tax=Pleodorina starrii TaxID=330485 RepID=A0A9W6BLP3_9CHLO|nr:hypothetical protein PLESTM_000134600 [Pleodorina starrii]GLC54055.1 hypothetical protein PLESTB_000818700 [Pleodorina starrii]GLC64637.1 hypothetical protein PLESTF_000187400 [Pleodorina starrii]
MADRRPQRPSALRAQGAFQAAASSEDEGMEGRQTRSTRRVMRVDLSKLDTQSLLRYRKVHKLGDTPATATKEDLIPSVTRHFAQQVVDEEEVLMKFVLAVQKHNKQMRQINAVQQQKAQEQRLAMQQHLQQHLQAGYGRQVPQLQQMPANHLKGGVIKQQRR